MVASVIRASTGYLHARRFLKSMGAEQPPNSSTRNAADGVIVIPALREQMVIGATLDHLADVLTTEPNTHVIVAGSEKEADEARSSGEGLDTAGAVQKWFEAAAYSDCDALRQLARATSYFASNRIGRAEQANDALAAYCALSGMCPAFVAIYDADSRPARGSFASAATSMAVGRPRAGQQALQFVDAANCLSRAGARPLVVANALYESSWAITSELAGLVRYVRALRRWPNTRAVRAPYLQGHGQFLNSAAMELLGALPESGVDHGVQAGYRLAMLRQEIRPLASFCSDDAPGTLDAIVLQHMRWFAGSVEILKAGRWVRGHGGSMCWYQIADNYLMAVAWLVRPVVVATAIALGLRQAARGQLIALTPLAAVLWYCYGLPLVALRLSRVSIEVRRVDWLVLPLAAAMKSIGPWLFVALKTRSCLSGTPLLLPKTER